MPEIKQQIEQFISSYYRFFAVLTVLLIGFGFTQWLLLPQYRQIQVSGIDQYQDLRLNVAASQAHLDKLKNMKRSYNELDQRLLGLFDTALPTDYSEADAYEEIAAVFRDTPLQVQSINYTSTAGDDDVAAKDTTANNTNPDDPTTTLSANYTPVQLTVNVRLTEAIEAETTDVTGAAASETTTNGLAYEDFKELLKKIEQQQHLFNLEQLVYSPTSDSFTFVFTTYERTATAL